MARGILEFQGISRIPRKPRDDQGVQESRIFSQMPKRIHKIKEKFPKALGHPVFRDPGNPVFPVYQEKYRQFLDGLGNLENPERVSWMSIKIQYMNGCREIRESKEIKSLLDGQANPGNTGFITGFPASSGEYRKSRKYRLSCFPRKSRIF